MPVTPIYSLPFPSLSDSPNGPAQIQSLATATESAINGVDNRVGSIEAAYPRGRIASATSASTALSTSEAVVDIFTVALTSGRRYELTCNYVFGTAATNYFFRMRYEAGSTAGLGGTIFHRIAPNGAAGENTPVTLVGAFVAPSSGTFTVSITCFMGTATGNIPNDGTNHAKFAILKDVGL